MILTPGHVFLKSICLAFFGLAIHKTCVIPCRDVPKVTHEIHHFVVAQQAHDLAASLRRLVIERYHQIQNFARLWSAIYEISKLNEGGFAARPVVLLVDELYSLQNGAEVVEVSVDIPDGHQ
jgi:hypothetical protein